MFAKHRQSFDKNAEEVLLLLLAHHYLYTLKLHHDISRSGKTVSKEKFGHIKMLREFIFENI